MISASVEVAVFYANRRNKVTFSLMGDVTSFRQPTVSEVLEEHQLSPMREFAKIAVGRSDCRLCLGEGTVSEIVYNLHSGAAISFDMARKCSAEEVAPCPECYGRGHVFSKDERVDRALALLHNNMPVVEEEQGPVVVRFHKAKTIEDAYNLDKQMQLVSPDDDDESGYVMDMDDIDEHVDQLELEEANANDWWMDDNPEPEPDDDGTKGGRTDE